MKKYSSLWIYLVFAGSLLVACSSPMSKKLDSSGRAYAGNLLKTHCNSCHSSSVSGMAPSYKEVKDQYATSTSSRKQYIEEMNPFLLSPSLKNSHMPGSVSRYGLMPRVPLSKADARLVSSFIYQENGSDFQGLGSTDSTVSPEIGFLEEGQRIASETQKVLGSNLMQMMKTRGAVAAIGFCDVKAIPLTDSMSMVYGVTIKRVSDKVRNPSNRASEQELAYIHLLKEQLSHGNKLQPILIREDSNIKRLYPILTSAACLKCHGLAGKDMDEATLSTLNEKYPDDQATGYQENQIRGIWVIESNP